MSGAPLILFGFPNVAEGRTTHKLEIPKLGSLILTHSLDGEVKGLNAFPQEDRPNPVIPFFAFRIMLALGLAMAGLGLWALWRRWRGSIYEDRWLQRAAFAMGPTGFAALLAGWFVTETGRQPFLIYGLMRTSEGVSAVSAGAVAASLTAFVLVYLLVFGAGTLYALAMMARPPEPFEDARDDPAKAQAVAPHGLADTAKGGA
jgi:cytochrome d ubiquinol oxidase subunit I